VVAILTLITITILGVIGIYLNKSKEKKRKPKLEVRIEECNHGHPAKNHPSFMMRPKVLITNVGEQSTSIYRVRVEGISETSKILLSPEDFDINPPLRVESKDAKYFKEELSLKGELSEENYYVHFTFYFSEGFSKTSSFLSKYHEILRLASIFKKPDS